MRKPTPIGFVGVLLLLVVLPRPASSEIISGIGVIPNPFSPNGDGVYDSTAVYYSLSDSAQIELTVLDSTMAGVAVLPAGWEKAGEHRHWWDGSVGEAGRLPVADGDYWFHIEATPVGAGAEEAYFRFVLDTTAPAVADLLVMPSRFSPDGDGVGDSLLVCFTVEIGTPEDWVAVAVIDSLDEVVTELYRASGADSVSVHWNGTDGSGSAVDDGLYSIHIETSDPAGNSLENQVPVDLDIEPPHLGVGFPDTALAEVRVDSTETIVQGWAYDRAGVVRLEISPDGEDWEELAFSASDTSDAVLWAVSLACTACVVDTLDEKTAVFIRGYDGCATSGGHGHVNSSTSAIPVLSFDVVFDVAGPQHTSSSIMDADNTYLNGETVSITTSWDDGEYDIEADFSSVDSEFDSENVRVVDNGSGLYTVTYTISQENTLAPLGNVAVPITATDYFDRQASDSSLTVNVEESPGLPEGFSLDRNRFDPTDAEYLTVGVGDYLGDVSVEIFNLAGTLVKTLKQTGGSPVVWYGKNASGDVVASGVYFLRIATDTGEAVRKVAIIK